MAIQKIGVVGAGAMGHGIAQIAAQAGLEVKLHDISEELIQKGIAKVQNSLGKLVEKGKLALSDKEALLSRIKAEKDVKGLSDCDVIIEAASENPGIKFKIFQTLDEIAKPEAILASNTSSISITLLAAKTKRPDKVVGMHFFNPVPVMKLVEVIKGLSTSEKTYEAAVALVEKIGKVPAQVKDSAAFAVNRILIPMINEAVQVLYEGIADVETIDKTMKLGCNHPMGPLELADFVGLEVLLSALEVMEKDLGPKYHPCPLLRKYVEAGWFGRKSGRGFYTYSS